MMQLTPYQRRILGESSYRRDCGWNHDPCDSCGEDVHAGQLVWTNGPELHHTGCLLPGILIHQQHGYVWDGRS